MKLYHGGKILIGLVVFLAFVAFPFYYNIGTVNAKPEPKLDTPVIQKLSPKDKHCVQSKAFMQSEHMQLLNHWRDTAVREGNRVYEGMGGKKYFISLQNTCMNCHSNKKDFCDKCHTYMGVKPYCWSCHFVPKEKEKEL